MKLLAAIILATAFNAHAGKWVAKPQVPDDWSDSEYHAGVSALIGIGATYVLPNRSPIEQWALCQVPGAIHEFAPFGKNVRSNKDLIANSLGCAFGVVAGHGFFVQPREGGVMVYRAWEFR